MVFQTACYTDQGEVRTSNQDSYCVKIADSGRGPAAMVVVCDGMGGLIQGELASAEVVRAFDSWFCHYLPALLETGLTNERLSAQWNGLIQGVNRAIRHYGESRGVSLGTTVTALLVAQGQYYLLHAGDCRAYLLQRGGVLKLTADQTLAAREVRAGRLRAEDLPQDPRQHVLTQCVGVGQVTPDFLSAPCPDDCMFLLCSDGFYHTVTEGELARLSHQADHGARVQLELERFGGLCRSRGEGDNLTAACLMCLAPSCAPTASMDGQKQPGVEPAFRVVLDLTQIHTDQTI